MAKCIVVFENGQRCDVVVKKSGAVIFPPDAPRPDAAPVSEPDIERTFRKIFLEVYLADARRALANASKDRPDAAYFAEKRVFLEKVIGIVETESVADSGFSQFAEPFFFNEWKRLTHAAYTCVQKFSGQKPAGKLPSRWQKARLFFGRLLLHHFAALRKKRDGYTQRFLPLNRKDIALCMIGTMMHLERQIAENPEREDLPELSRLYRELYFRSRLSLTGRRLVTDFRESGKEIPWRNPETVDFLLSFHSPDGMKPVSGPVGREEAPAASALAQ